MGYRADIYSDNTASLVSDTPSVGIKVHMEGMTVMQARPITKEQFDQLSAQMQAMPGGILTFDPDTGDLSVAQPVA